MPAPIRLVIVDEASGASIAERATVEGIDTWTTAREDHALAEVVRRAPDAIVAGDVQGSETLAMCRRFREQTTAPLLAILASLRPELRVELLDACADDVVTRQCYLPEIVARVRAMVRRARGEVGTRGSRLVIGTLTVDTTTRVAAMEGHEIALAQNEILALCALAKSPSRPLSRDQLLQAVHVDSDAAFDRSIDVIISRLRAKLGPEARRLKTIRGIGYMLVC
ncbi:response regulator transcription factor [soil metagenome]